MAQGNNIISGTVTSVENGDPLPGVNVLVKGQTMGTVTDINGEYSIALPDNIKTLTFSFIGYQSKQVDINQQSVVDVQLRESVAQLNEVVVTANAIEREKRELGYAVSTIDEDEITKARETNIVNSLAGKIPGLQVTSASGAVGASSQILIRGANSINGNNQPLFVIDGVPVINEQRNPQDVDSDWYDVDFGNTLQDISPDDIKSMTVLKGAAAAALYGSRARDGAIIITTKKGSFNSKTSVTVNSSIRFENPLILPDFQNEYSPGQDGQFRENTGLAWGAKISEVQDQLFPNWQGDSVRLQAYPDNVSDFYETGVLAINSVAMSGGTENLNFRLGYTNTSQAGIIPNNDLQRHSISLNAGSKFDNGFSASVGITYVKNINEGRAYDLGIYGVQRTVDINQLRNNFQTIDGKENGLTLTQNNPFWLLNKNVQEVERDRLFGFAKVQYDFTDWMNIQARVGNDFYVENRFRPTAKNTIGQLTGAFRYDDLFSSQFNSDIILTANRNITSKLGVTGILGYNVNSRFFKTSWNNAQEIEVAGLYRPGNAKSNVPNFNSSLRRLWGAYADIGFSWDNWAFINATIRNDNSSTLPKDNNSYWYPSVSTSLILTEGLGIASNVLSYWKLRANYAQVGSDTDPYQLGFLYQPSTTIFGYFTGAGNSYPINGDIIAFGGPGTIPPVGLRPEQQKSWEIGSEFQLFNGRVGLDITYYNTITSDQIVDLPIARSSGYSAKLTNIAEVSNKGIEALLLVTPIQTKSGFQWDLSVNFARNVQRLEKLTADDGEDEEFPLSSGLGDIQIKAKKGEPFSLYGSSWLTDTLTGSYIINPTTGYRLIEENVNLGSIFPEFIMGFQNSFSYKGFNLSFLVHWQQGGVMYSQTIDGLRNSGHLAETAVNREGTFIEDGVIIDGDGTRRENDVPVESVFDWYRQSYTDATEPSTYDASYIKLREARLSYRLPQKWLERTPFGNINVGIEGRNLFLFMSNIPHIDPETTTFDPEDTGGGIEQRAIPSTRSYGFNLSFTF